jgi:hypothetical protein
LTRRQFFHTSPHSLNSICKTHCQLMVVPAAHNSIFFSNVIPAIFLELVANPLRSIFYRKTCPPSRIPLGHPIPHLLPKNLVLMPTPRPAIGTFKMHRIAVQPCKSTQTDHHCQAKTDACPSARSLADIQGHSYAQFYPSSQIPSPTGQLLCPI